MITDFIGDLLRSIHNLYVKSGFSKCNNQVITGTFARLRADTENELAAFHTKDVLLLQAL